MAWRIRVEKEGKLVCETPLSGSSLNIGRGANNPVRLQGEEVSQLHASLFVKSDGVLLVDLDSANGTWVDENKIDRSLLRSGSVFRISGFTLTLLDSGPAKPQAQIENSAEQTLRHTLITRPGAEADDTLLTFWGHSASMQKVLALVKKVAATELPVLLTGETGTGKGFTAAAIHFLSARKNGPFQTVDCSTIPRELMESELFGHEKGAFTGAVTKKLGQVQMAHLGTLFLDEIGDLPYALQPKLLRFLEQKKFERVGGTETHEIDSRIVAATNRNLEKEAPEGRFRSDLLYRINSVSIELPPLRQRTEDIIPLAHHFLKMETQAAKGRELDFATEALSRLQNHPWPGNIRELRNRIRRSVLLSTGPLLNSEAMGFPEVNASDEEEKKSQFFINLHEAREWVDRKCIAQSLKKHDNNLSHAAQELGIARITLRELIKKYGL